MNTCPMSQDMAWLGTLAQHYTHAYMRMCMCMYAYALRKRVIVCIHVCVRYRDALSAVGMRYSSMKLKSNGIATIASYFVYR